MKTEKFVEFCFHFGRKFFLLFAPQKRTISDNPSSYKKMHPTSYSDIADMIHLGDLTEAAICRNVFLRYKSNKIYVRKSMKRKTSLGSILFGWRLTSVRFWSPSILILSSIFTIKNLFVLIETENSANSNLTLLPSEIMRIKTCWENDPAPTANTINASSSAGNRAPEKPNRPNTFCNV